MLTPRDARTVNLLKRRLERIMPVQKVIVYGSRARGNAAPDSDLDVFVELSSLTPTLRRQISEIAWKVSLDNDVVISTFVASTDDILHGPLGIDPIIIAIDRDGVLI